MIVLALALSLVTASPILADEVGAQVNGSRSGSLPVVASADQVAGASAAAQAAAGKLFHTNLSGLLGPCSSVAEVVGAGPNVSSVFAAFRQSPDHWSIITNSAWTAMGTGLAAGGDGKVYVSVVFCAQAGGAAPVAPRPASPASSDRAPAPADPAPAGEALVNDPDPADVLDEALPAVGARRGEIRARLDQEAESALPDWYVGVCGDDDRELMLEGADSESGDCPKTT